MGGQLVDEGGRSTNQGLAVVLCVLQVADRGPGVGGLSAQSTPMLSLSLSDIVSDLLRVRVCPIQRDQRSRGVPSSTTPRSPDKWHLSCLCLSPEQQHPRCRFSRTETGASTGASTRRPLETEGDAVYPALALKANRQTASRNPRLGYPAGCCIAALDGVRRRAASLTPRA